MASADNGCVSPGKVLVLAGKCALSPNKMSDKDAKAGILGGWRDFGIPDAAFICTEPI